MKFSVVVEQVLDLLQCQSRVSDRMLKREFDIGDELFADLTVIDGERKTITAL